MKITLSHEDKLDHVIAVIEALYGVRLQQVGDGTTTTDPTDAHLPDDGGQGATKPRHG